MKVSTVFHSELHFLDGVNLTGGTPLVEWVECLGVAGTLSEIPLSVGWGASVEMIGSVEIPSFAVPIFGCRWCHTSPLVQQATLTPRSLGLMSLKSTCTEFSFRVPWLCFSL